MSKGTIGGRSLLDSLDPATIRDYRQFVREAGIDATRLQSVRLVEDRLSGAFVAAWAGSDGDSVGSGLASTGFGHDGRAMIRLVAEPGSLREMRADLADLGIQELGRNGRSLDISLDTADLPQLLNVNGITVASPVLAMTNVGSVESQAPQAMASDTFSATFRADGTGVTIGILSDSFDKGAGLSTSYADDIASGDLPAGITILDDSATGDLIDEGRAMAQLIHDVAPGAAMAFHTAFTGEAEFAQGILDLATISDIVVDDVGYSSEPVYMDGIIAQAVDQAFANGVAYFSSAGNSAMEAYETTYVSVDLSAPAGLSAGDEAIRQFLAANGYDTAHDFDPGAGVDITQGITLPGPGLPANFLIQWDDLFASAFASSPGASTDMDVLVFFEGSFLGSLSSLQENIGADPLEFISIQFNSGSGTLDFVMAKYDGPDPERFIWLEFGAAVDLSSASVMQYPLPSGTSYGHPSAEGGLGIGAAYYEETPAFGIDPALHELFSSSGGSVPILFEADGTPIPGGEIRQRVDIVAPDGTDTTFFPPFPGADADGTGFPNFFGTSAAAPHVAAVAALLKEIVPDATPTQIYDALRQSALPMDDRYLEGDQTAAVDPTTGHGYINPEGALRLLANVVDGSDDRDRLSGTADVDVLLGLKGADLMKGGAGNDRLIGDKGADRLYGEDDDDVLFGGGGADLLRGGAGDDRIDGDEGRNTMYGDAGADTFVIRFADRADRIADFESGIDTLLLSQDLGAGTVTLQDVSGGTNVRLDGNLIAQIVGLDILTTDIILEGDLAYAVA